MKRHWFALPISLLFLQGPAHAQSLEEFYKQNRLTLIVGYAAGGAYDAYTRLLARHIGRHIPGTPTIVVQNMPGAGSVVAANYVFNVAPADGSVLGAFHQRIGVEPKLQPTKQLRFDGREFTWIGSLAKNVSVCVTWHAAGLRTVDDLKAREITAGASANVDSAAVFARATNAVLGTRMKLITGYGSEETNLALERGEIEARCGWGYASLMATRSEWVKENKVNIPLVFGMERLAELPQTPTLMEFVKKPEDKGALEVLLATQDIARPIAGPPRMPKDRAQALRNAFDKALADPQLLAEAKKSAIDLEPVSGVEIEKLIRRLYDLPPESYARVHQFLMPVSGETRLKK
jgi:tripartite-type tricarboxylate transporter receptor subunit TctC